MNDCLSGRTNWLLPGLGLALLLGMAPGRAAQKKTVDVCHPVQREVTDFGVFHGRVDAAETVDLRARVSGYLLRVKYQAGSRVKKGDLLFEIDPRLYEVVLERARAVVQQAQAARQLAKVKYDRTAALVGRGAATAEELEQAKGSLQDAEAAVKTAQLNLERAKLDLDFTRVTAPINGRISRPRITPGNLVTADTTLLATIVSEDPLYVYFDMDERTFLRLRRLERAGKIRIEGGRVPVVLGLAGEPGFPHEGVLESFDNHVNPTSGTIQVRAVFKNPERLLIPGLFARIRMPLGASHTALLVPESAVGINAGAKSILIINEKNVVERRVVKLGGQHDGMRVIEAGLRPDDWVVVSPLQGLQPGATVEPRRLSGPEPGQSPPGGDRSARPGSRG